MGKILKNIILILIAFLLISVLVAAFSNNSKVQQKSISDIVNLVDQQKVATLVVTDSTVTAKLKDSDIQETAQIGQNDNIYEILKDSGISTDKIRAVNIQKDSGSLISNLASTVLPFLIPFALVS